MSDGRAQEILLFAGSGKKKSETSKSVDDFAFSRRLDGALAGTNRLDRFDEFGKHVRFRDRNIVSAQHEFQFRGERREALYGSNVGIESGFRAEEPDGSGIVRVAGKKQSVFAVQQRNRVRRVARSRKDFERAAAQIYFKAIVDEVRDFPWFCGVGFWIEPLWQIPAELVGSNFLLRIFARTFRIRPRELGVHAVDESELPVASNVIVVGVRVEHDDRTRRQLGGDFANVTDAYAGVEQERLLVAHNEIGDNFFRLMRLVDGKDSGDDFVDLEPWIVRENALERFVFRAWQRAAPFGDLRGHLQPGL